MATAEIDIAVDRNKFLDVVVVVEWKMDNMKFHDPFDLIDRKMYRNCFDVAKYVVFDNSNNVACKFAEVPDTAAGRDCWRAAYRKTLKNSSWSCCSLTYINFIQIHFEDTISFFKVQIHNARRRIVKNAIFLERGKTDNRSRDEEES